MGVPTFFKWLITRYPKILIDAFISKQDPNEMNLSGIDPALSNPNVDNLYFDLNGIIHPCTTGLKGKKPKNEAEMFNNIFEYVDELMSIVRPGNLVYFAVDGVAPRAK